ncbi:MAG: methyltransferase domain-containing protein [Candidatus Elarobacter sp.]
MPSAFADLRAQLVREIFERGVLRSARIADAFRAVPRHVFLPGVAPEDVYSDRSIPVKLDDGIPISSSSQPAMMAEMLEQLALRDGERVLEIGAGSGYNAALLATLVGRTGFVATVDLDRDIATAARGQLDRAGFSRVRVICADGTDGDREDAPFDAIIATVGVGDLPASWFAQLRPGGRLVMPLALRTMQKVVCFERTASGLSSTSIVDGGFMMLRGTTASVAAPAVTLDDATVVRVLDPAAVDRRAIAAALGMRTSDTTTIAPLSIDDVWLSFGWWLALHDDGFARVTVSGPQVSTTRVPDITGLPRTSSHCEATTLGLVVGDELAVFAPLDDGQFVIRSFGHAPNALARMQAAIAAWHAAGRPRNDRLHIEVVSRSTNEPTTLAGEVVTVELPSAHAIVRWRGR